jgi:hypothetical protein
MLGDCQLGNPEPRGLRTVCGELFDARRQRQVQRVAPQVDVVINHAAILAHGRQDS